MTVGLAAYVFGDEGSASALITAGGALLGVLVGGLLTAGVNEYSRSRSETRLQRAAGRLLAAEFEQAARDLRSVADRRVATVASLPGRIASWEPYREILASRLSSDEWVAVARAVGEARESIGKLDALITSSVAMAQLSTTTQAELRDSAAALDLAVKLLRS